MGDSTSIEWTDATWNPVRGCSRVSKGCEHCYAESVARRFSGPGQPYEGLVRLDREGRAKAQWNGTVRMVPEHLADPLRWTRPRRVFVNSMSDLFHEALAFEDIAAIFGVMAACPQHTFQVLTKRPERAREFFGWYEGASGAGASQYAAVMEARGRGLDIGTIDEQDWPLPNVWLGVSVEDQAAADERIPHLLACPAAVRFVSYEPALGPVVFQQLWLTPHTAGGDDGVGWIIVGGESGPGARPFDLAWARRVVTQCREAGVACFVKQLGAGPYSTTKNADGQLPDYAGRRAYMRACGNEERLTIALCDRKGGDMSEWPEDLRVREVPYDARDLVARSRST